jgi:hypothetical protein
MGPDPDGPHEEHVNRRKLRWKATTYQPTKSRSAHLITTL